MLKKIKYLCVLEPLPNWMNTPHSEKSKVSVPGQQSLEKYFLKHYSNILRETLRFKAS